MIRGKLLFDWDLHQYDQSERVQIFLKLNLKMTFQYHQNEHQWPSFLKSLPPNLFCSSATCLLTIGKFSPTGCMFFRCGLGFCQMQVLSSSLNIKPLTAVPLLQNSSAICNAWQPTFSLCWVASLTITVRQKDGSSFNSFRFYMNLFVFIQHCCQFRCNLKLCSSPANR